MSYDFAGWATKANLKCGDGRIIHSDAFKHCDGKTVPLVWNHQHKSVDNVLGRATLLYKPEGVWAECYLNDSPSGQKARECIKHGDVKSLSICANNVEQIGNEVLHGNINEVSVVLTGCNPGAFIESVMYHSEPMSEDDTEGIFYCGENASELIFSHADDPEPKKEEPTVADENKKKNSSGKTVGEVIESMTDEQKEAMAMVIAEIAGNKEDDETSKKEDNEVKHNLFADPEYTGSYGISQEEFKKIFADAKNNGGSLKEAFNHAMEDNDTFAHSIDTTGMTVSTGTQTYGFRDPEMLFPEFRNLNPTPEWLSRDMGWVNDVMANVHRSPFSRIKSMYADITEDDARARGYIKGNMKKEEFFTLMKRTTTPTTVYKKQKMDRDDIIDITDLDVVSWIKGEMRMMLDEELARAFLIGDGRASDSDDKIQEINIRPIVKDVPLFNTKVVVKAATADDDATTYKKVIKAMIKSRKNYKGSGNPTFYTTQDVISEMLLIEDNNGRPLYKSEDELRTALRVSKIVPVEVMENYKLDVDGTSYPLIGVVVNLKDYNVGADKGGAINTFDDFDIDVNQYKYLIETRCSGALIKPYSALTYVLDKASSGAAG